MSQKEPSTLDMTIQQQEHVRNALYFLRAKFGSWRPLARALHYEEQTMVQCANATRGIAAGMAFRVARFVNVTIDALLSGKFPEPGVCPRCAYKLPLDGVWKNARGRT